VIRVAVDAMGGDHAPRAEVAGALAALAEWPGTLQILLVGQPDVIEAELARHPAEARAGVTIVPASEVIGMAEAPLQAIRRKRDSSLVVGLALQKEGRADAFISAGNTGAVLAGSTVILGLHDGVARATVAPLLPTATRPVLLLDAGANVDCTAKELVGFAWLGTIYMHDVLGREHPAVGLLSIGEEREKGNAAVKEAYALLEQAAGIRFVGNIEGRDILAPRHPDQAADIVVCDGFVGNVLLKFYESAGRVVSQLLKQLMPEALERPESREVLRILDYTTYGGAPLLGVQGVSIICHGSSSGNAIKNAIGVASQSVASHLSAHIGAQFAQRAEGGAA